MRAVLLGSVLVLLAGCGGVRPHEPVLLTSARSFWDAGNYYQAAEAYQQMFERSGEPGQAVWAARALLRAGEYRQALEWLRHVARRLPPEMQPLEIQAAWRLVEAEALTGLGRHEQAVRLLTFQPEALSDVVQREQYYDLKSRLLRHQGRFLDAALTQIAWLSWLASRNSDANSRQQVSDRLVAGLLEVPASELEQAMNAPGLSPFQRGWLAAALVGFGMDRHGAAQWLQRWTQHPAAHYFLGVSDGTPREIAVLLPLSGRYAGIARSIQQGMIAASYADENGHTLSFYDTGDKGQRMADAYFSALENGADFIIGPLSRSAVRQLSAMPAPTVPLLALNDSHEDGLSPGFYRFPLSAEDEAGAAAQRMRAEGHARAVVIAPRSRWGQRVAAAFARRLARESGQVLGSASYDEQDVDHSALLRQTLGLDASRQRARRLQSLIGQKIESVERIDPRIEVIFLAASPRQARMIRPQLKFLHAGHVPIYATSQVYSGVPNPGLDKDLNGIRFTDAPIVVRPEKAREETGLDITALGPAARYFAFGYDALRLTGRLAWMDAFNAGVLRGLSGELFLRDGRVYRRLDWAWFRHGVPEPLPDIARFSDEPVLPGVVGPAAGVSLPAGPR